MNSLCLNWNVIKSLVAAALFASSQIVHSQSTFHTIDSPVITATPVAHGTIAREHQMLQQITWEMRKWHSSVGRWIQSGALRIHAFWSKAPDLLHGIRSVHCSPLCEQNPEKKHSDKSFSVFIISCTTEQAAAVLSLASNIYLFNGEICPTLFDRHNTWPWVRNRSEVAATYKTGVFLWRLSLEAI